MTGTRRRLQTPIFVPEKEETSRKRIRHNSRYNVKTDSKARARINTYRRIVRIYVYVVRSVFDRNIIEKPLYRAVGFCTVDRELFKRPRSSEGGRTLIRISPVGGRNYLRACMIAATFVFGSISKIRPTRSDRGEQRINISFHRPSVTRSWIFDLPFVRSDTIGRSALGTGARQCFVVRTITGHVCCTEPRYIVSSIAATCDHRAYV